MAWRLYYDGGCNLCHVSKLRCERWAERAQLPLIAMPLQSEEGIARGYGVQAMVLETNEGIYRGADAWLILMKISPWYIRWVGWIARLPGARVVFKWAYSVIARYRIRWFGSRACPMPPR